MAAVHAGTYALVQPEWALADEQQYVDYVLSVAEGDVPRIDDGLHEGILESTVAQQRHVQLGLSEEQGPIGGLERKSYVAYHPPAYGLLGAPVAWMAGGDALETMWGLRALGVMLAACFAAVVGYGASRISRPGTEVRAAVTGGLFAALIPAAADAGGRATNDLLSAVTVALVAVAAVAWMERRDDRSAVIVGVCGAAAVATKATALAAAGPIVALAALYLPPRARPLVYVALPPALVFTAWSALLWVRYGVVDGSRAFVDEHGSPFPHRLPSVHEVLDHGLLTSWTTHSPGAVGPLAWIIFSVAVIAGVWAFWHVHACADGRWLVVLAGAGVVGLTAVYLVSSVRGLTNASGRLFLSAWPLLLMLAGAGLASLRLRVRATLLAAWLGVAVGALAVFPGPFGT